MIVLFIVLLILLGFLAQRYSLQHAFDAMECDYWPEQNIVDPEEEFDITISLKNKKTWPMYYVRVEHTYYRGMDVNKALKGVYRDPGTGNHVVKVSTWLKSKQKTMMNISVSIPQRGRYVFFHPKIICGDFLGIKEVEQEINQFREVVVAPKASENLELKEILGNFLGDYSVRRFILEDPILTMGFREYTGREPMKMISWKQSAKRQTLMVKEYDHTMEPAISVILNIAMDRADIPEFLEDLLENCFSITRTVCSYLEEQGISYDFYTNALQKGSSGDDYMVKEGLGRRHFERILESLGRSIDKPMFSFEKLWELAETSGGRERGKIIVTPMEDALGLGYQMRSSVQQNLVLDASKL